MNIRSAFTPFGIAIFIFSLLYLGAEISFNRDLLDIAGTVKSGPDDIDHLQHFGRTISAFGFTLLVLGLFAGQKFRLKTREHWIKFWVVALSCWLPLLWLFFKGDLFRSKPDFGDMLSIFLPLFGFYFTLASRGRYPALLIVSLFLLAGPAMYVAQKQIIEKLVIDRSTWREMSNARYMLMLRAGLENCTIALQGLKFCDTGEAADPELKSFRMLMPTLWMMSPSVILGDLADQSSNLIMSAAARGMWFSADSAYNTYVQKITDKHDQYAAMLEKYYTPYKKASDLYIAATQQGDIDARTSAAAAKVEQDIDDGWNAYLKAVDDYSSAIAAKGVSAMQQAMVVGQLVKNFCNGNNRCPAISEGRMQAMAETARDRAAAEFTARAGYPPDIEAKEVFIAHPSTQKRIRQGVEKTVREDFGMPSFTLPDDWVYDESTFQGEMEAMIKERAIDGWQSRFGNKIPPGLSKDEFIRLLGAAPLPNLDKIKMNEDEFFDKVVLPQNFKIVDQMMDKLAAERKAHPDDATGVDEGKDYARAIYIPTLSLVVSLVVVMITVLRGTVVAATILFKAAGAKGQALIAARGGAAIVMIILLGVLPYHLVHNPYIGGDVYDRYMSAAKKKHAFLAMAVDWAMHMQPLIYGMTDGIYADRSAAQNDEAE